MPNPIHDLLAALLALHDEVDRESASLAERHRDRLACERGCSGCCVDDITVFEIEAERIRRRHASLLGSGRPHARGACAFLDARGSCRIYEDRPYVCRTQGLPLRWIEEHGAGVPTELRDICSLNEIDSEPLEDLPAAQCWTIGPVESRLVALQRAFDGTLKRTGLRDLFRKGPADPEG